MSEIKIPFLPLPAADLPFDAEQAKWLAGFMAGLHSQLLVNQPSEGANNTAAVAQKSLHILFGTQTGNAEGIARDVAEQSKKLGFVPQVMDMDDVKVADLINMPRLLVITSTYGEGEMPDNAQILFAELCSASAPKLAGVYYSVLALGDTSYDDFCLAGIKWDQRLAELGASRVHARVDCDVDYEQPAATWCAEVLTAICDKGSDGSSPVAAAPKNPPAPKSAYNRKNPLLATLTNKYVLTGEHSSKQVTHYEFSLAGSGEVYEAGDALNILPENSPEYVEQFINAFGLFADAVLEDFGGKSLREVLRTEFEIRLPNNMQLRDLAKRAQNPKFDELLAPANQQQLMEFVYGKDWIDIARAFPLVRPYRQDELLALLKPLAPRAYSISSSINANPESVHLTVGSVRYQINNREHGGVCSTYLADDLAVGSQVRCYFTGNKAFSVPQDNAVPIIMVGPGTGIAPFRAFLQERGYRSEHGEQSGDNWLFFGDRNRDSDFLYRAELESLLEEKRLTRLDAAFSRDGAQKIYVQHLMAQNGAELFAWLERGAYFYICGDAYNMAKDVDKALHQLVQSHGGFDEAGAKNYINELKKAKRYVRDVY